MRQVGVSVIVVLAIVTSMLGEDVVPPEQTFEALFAEKVKKVEATPDRTDDVALAAELIASAGHARPEFARLLCTKAYDLASNPMGWDKAAEAKRLLAEKVPDEAAQHLDDAVKAYWQALKTARGPARQEVGEALVDASLEVAEALARQGDAKAAGMVRQAERAAKAAAPNRVGEVRDRMGEIGRRVRLEKEVGGLIKRLEDDPDNAAVATKLVRTLVADLDDPERALPYLDKCDDAEMKKYLPGAVKPIEQAPELACKELGTWYASLANQASSVAKEPMLVRAWQYLERYLRVHETEDLARAEAAKVMEKVEEGFEKLGPPKGLVVGPGRWLEMTTRIDITKDCLKGSWKRNGPFIVSRFDNCQLRMPCLLEGNYQMQIRLVGNEERSNGNLRFALPVGPNATTYHFCVSGAFSSLEKVDKRPLAPPGRIQQGREYLLDIRVVRTGEEARITVHLDGKPHLGWVGPRSKMEPVYYIKMPDWRSPGLGPAHSPTTFKSVRLRMISGKMRLMR